MNSVDDVCDFFGEIWGLSKNQKILLKSNVQKLVLDSTATAEADLAKARGVIAGYEDAAKATVWDLAEWCGKMDTIPAADRNKMSTARDRLQAALTTARNYLEGK